MSRYFDRGSNRQYTAYEPLDSFADDRMSRAAIVRGSQMLLKALEGESGPRGLIWVDRSGGHSPVHRYPEAVARMAEREAFADSLRVKRDPCPYCNVRGDIGCRHQSAA